MTLRPEVGDSSRAVSAELVPYNSSDRGRLSQVIIGLATNLFDNPPLFGAHQNNLTQKAHAARGLLPTKEKAVFEFEALQSILTANGVEVFEPDPCPPETGLQSQMTCRDIGFVIENTFFVAGMKSPNRKEEWRGIEKFLRRMPPEHVVRVPESLIIEGGDIVVDKGNVFVGISQRTTREGAEFLSDYTNLNVVPVELRSLAEGKDVLHLDCGFMPVGSDSALIYPDGIADMPTEMQQYYPVPLTHEEQALLGTNVLSLSPDSIVTRRLDALERVNTEMSKRAINVIETPFDQAPMRGGSVRCCTLPIRREGL